MKLGKAVKKSSNIKISINEKGNYIISNESDNQEKIIFSKILHLKNQYLNVEFKAKVLKGSGAYLAFVNRHKANKMNVIINSVTSSIEAMKGFLLPALFIKPKTTIEILNIDYSISEQKECNFGKYLGKKNYLLITPLYPSPDNLYACGFVHARVKEYKKAGINVDVTVIHSNNESAFYSIDDIDVYKTDFCEMRSILMSKKYDGILVHFFDEMYAKYFDTAYLTDTPVYLWNHGADILYWDYKDIYTPYFQTDYILPESMEDSYKLRDKYIKKFAANNDFNWIFVSNSEKNRAEDMHKLKFNNSIVIPNVINSDIFKFHEKSEDARKNIFLIRRFDNTKKYAIDIAVLTILELSRRECFKDLNFYICGEGNYHDQLVEPIKGFSNVHIITNFMTHEQIAQYHKKCGIGLFPTRQDTQGVSALEAASSGLVVISSDLDVIHEYFDENLGMICPVEDYVAYADKIEYLYNNPKEFLKLSKKMSEHTYDLCNIDKTINKEIKYIKENAYDYKSVIYPIKKIPTTPLLTITIPAYNSEKFLAKCLLSLLKANNSYLTEILVINDGSKDNTLAIAKQFEELTTVNGKSIVKAINKSNGGHGSGINKGLELANGKYFRVIDSDDWVDTQEFDDYLDKLQNEDVDLILNDYSEARTFEKKPFRRKNYDFMTPDVIYNINDIMVGSYGFPEWGPTLPTATYKTECLRKTNFKLKEKTFYVDMQYNAYSIIDINTVKRYTNDIYRYFIGNVGQSVSKAGMMRNYKHHEDVIMILMDCYTNDQRLTLQKREYILRKLLLPMVNTQYYIYFEFFKSGKKFNEFEKRIKQYPNLLGYAEFNTRRIKFHRATKGIFVKINPLLHSIKYKIKKIFRRSEIEFLKQRQEKIDSQNVNIDNNLANRNQKIE